MENNCDTKTGKIYKICDFEDTKRYIGSTCEKYLSNRLAGHRKEYKRWKAGKVPKVTSYCLFDEFGVENCKIILLESFEYTTREELKKKEAEYITTVECVNKNIPARTKEDWNREHPDYNKNYYINNKERLLVTTECKCGGKYSIATKNLHTKSKRHIRYLESQKRV